jgi:hypothetical protein
VNKAIKILEAEFEKLISDSVPEHRREAASLAFHNAVVSAQGLEYRNAKGQRTVIERIAREVIAQEAPRAKAPQLEDIDEATTPPMLEDIDEGTQVPSDWQGSGQEWQTAAAAGAKYLLEHTPPPAEKPEWQPVGAMQRVGNEWVPVSPIEHQLRGRHAVLTNPSILPERKAEVLNKLLNDTVKATDETEWIERQLRPELDGQPRIAYDVLRAKAPPGMFHGLSDKQFQTKISRHRTKLGIN